MELGIGKRIKKRRTELGLTQDELAQRMGYKSKAAICKVEGGEDNITTDRIQRFAKALECSPSYLMGWEEITDDNGVIVTAKVKEGYYLNEETAREAQRVFEDPDTRMLFDAARDSKPENIRLAAEMLKRFKETNPNG